MAPLLAILLLAVSVKQDQASLRDGCDADADTIATLPAGAPVTIRYALSGAATPCYKVSAQSGGKTINGFLPGSALEGLETFEQGVREAAMLDLTQVMGAVRGSLGAGSVPKGAGIAAVMETATSLIESSQATKALQVLEAHPKIRTDPALMALAGVAAWRSDDDRKALEYWRASLDLQPNAAIENVYRRVEREVKGDQSTERLYGMRVALRYEPQAVPVETARQMVSVIDQEFARISAELGCSAEERILAIAQSRDAYRKTTDTAEWNGGQFDGRIRVPLFEGQGFDASMRRTLAHETTHACLTMMGRWPAWLQEGLAQKLSGDTLSPALREQLAAWAKEGKLPKLAGLGQDWSHLDTAHAVTAYALSLDAIELFYQDHGADGVRNLLRNPDRLATVTAELDKQLGL
jgi:hypothetical protein